MPGRGSAARRSASSVSRSRSRVSRMVSALCALRSQTPLTAEPRNHRSRFRWSTAVSVTSVAVPSPTGRKR